MYETDVGIYDHRKGDSAFSGVLFHQSEKFIDHYLYGQLLDLFLYKKVQSSTGLTFDEFLNRPRYEIDMMIEGVDRFLQMKVRTEEDELKKLKNEPGLKP